MRKRIFVLAMATAVLGTTITSCKKDKSAELTKAKAELETGKAKAELEAGKAKAELEAGKAKAELEAGKAKAELERLKTALDEIQTALEAAKTANNRLKDKKTRQGKTLAKIKQQVSELEERLQKAENEKNAKIVAEILAPVYAVLKHSKTPLGLAGEAAVVKEGVQIANTLYNDLITWLDTEATPHPNQARAKELDEKWKNDRKNDQENKDKAAGNAISTDGDDYAFLVEYLGSPEDITKLAEAKKAAEAEKAKKAAAEKEAEKISDKNRASVAEEAKKAADEAAAKKAEEASLQP